MNFLKYLSATATAVALAVSFASCGGNDEDEPGGGAGGDDDSNIEFPSDPSVPEMNPAEAKNFLEGTALEIVNSIDPTQQEALWKLTGYWCETYWDTEPPMNWGIDDFDDYDDYYKAPRHNSLKGFMKFVGKAAKGDAGAMGRAMNEVLNMARFSGVYEPGIVVDEYGDRYEGWVKTADSRDVIIRFPYNGATAELKGVAEGSTWSETYEGVTVEVPRKVTATLSDGRSVLVTAVLESNLNFNAHTVSAKLDATLMNITLKSITNGNNSTVTTETIVWYSGKQLATVSGEVNGTNMVDRNAIKNLFVENNYDYDEEYYDVNPEALSKMFKSGTVVSNVLDKVVVKAKVGNISELIETFEDCFDNYEYSSKSAAQAACRRQCDVLNRSMPAYLYLNGSSLGSAFVTYQPYLYEDYSYWKWFSEPVLAFKDGTTTSFEAYFGGNSFIDLDTPIRNIVYTIYGYWPFLVD